MTPDLSSFFAGRWSNHLTNSTDVAGLHLFKHLCLDSIQTGWFGSLSFLVAIKYPHKLAVLCVCVLFARIWCLIPTLELVVVEPEKSFQQLKMQSFKLKAIKTPETLIYIPKGNKNPTKIWKPENFKRTPKPERKDLKTLHSINPQSLKPWKL